MTTNAEALKKVIERRNAIIKELDLLSQRLVKLDSVSLSQGVQASLIASEINQGDYYSLDALDAYIKHSASFLKVSDAVLDLRSRLSDVTVALNQDEPFLKPLTEQLQNRSPEDKRLQEEEENAALRLGLIKNKLYSLLPNDLSAMSGPSLEQDPMDWLINLVTQQLQLKNIDVAAVDKLLLEKINGDSEDVLGKYVSIKWEKPGVLSRSIPSVVFSDKGNRLKEYVASYEDRLKDLEAAQAVAIESLENSLAIKEEKLKEFKKLLSENEIAFVNARQEIIDYFSNSKKSVKEVLKKINKASQDIESAQEQLSIIMSNADSIDCLTDLTAVEDLEFLEGTAQKVAAKVKCYDYFQAYSRVAKMKLDEANELCETNVLQYGRAKIWTNLSDKITKIKLPELSETQAASLTSLKEYQALVNKRIDEIRKQRAEPVQMEVEPKEIKQEPVKPDSGVVADLEVNAKQRYQIKTNIYLDDLTKDIGERLVAFNKAATPRSTQGAWYLQLKINLGCSDNVNTDDILDKLKILYNAECDSDPDAIKKREAIGRILQGAKQCPMKIALEKYHVVTKALKKLKDEGANGFINVLKEKESQETLNKHRDWSFMRFIRGCGARVVAIFSSEPRVSYGVLFCQPKGKRFVNDIANITAEESAKRRRLK